VAQTLLVTPYFTKSAKMWVKYSEPSFAAFQLTAEPRFQNSGTNTLQKTNIISKNPTTFYPKSFARNSTTEKLPAV